MEIEAIELGKQFQNEWIFKDFDFCFSTNKIYAITGPNGSGKSTLLQVISGFLPQTRGELTFRNNGSEVSADDFYKHITVATPYTELIEEFSAIELLNFHFKFKKLRKVQDLEHFLPELNLPNAKNKLIKNFSSGMKQRLKLGLAFYSDSPVVLLDEPTSNLDEQGINWYQKILSEEKDGRIVIIASNQSYEYEQCDNVIDILPYKGN